MRPPEVDALIESFKTRRVGRFLTLGLQVEGRESLTGLTTHAKTLDEARDTSWGIDVIVVSNEAEIGLLRNLEICIEEAVPGTTIVVDFACQPSGNNALRQVLDVVGKPPLVPIAVAVETSAGSSVRLVLACRKSGAQDGNTNEVAGPGASAEQELMVWALDPGSPHRPRIVEALRSGKGPNFVVGRNSRVQRVPWRVLETPALVPHWVAMGEDAALRAARLVPLRDVASIRPVSALEDVEKDVGAPSLLLGWVSRSIDDLSAVTSTVPPGADSIVVSIGSAEISAEYLALHLRRFPEGSLFELPLGSGDQRCAALGFLPVMVLGGDRRARLELGMERARRALEQLQAIRGAIAQQRLSLLGDDETCLEAEARLRELDQELMARVAPSVEAQILRDAERLPAPLARGLRTWQVGDSSSGKLEALLQFFEAAAEIHATVLLSGLSRSGISSKVNLEFSSKGEPPVLQRAAFGTWIKILEKCRGQLERVRPANTPEHADGSQLVRQAFAVPSAALPSILCKKEVVDVFEEAANVRNAKLAHGGFLAASLAERAQGDLVAKLQIYLALTGPWWATMSLLLVKDIDVVGSDFEITCARSIGLSAQGTTVALRLSSASKKGTLILHGEGQSGCLPLLPLLRLHDPSAVLPEVCFYSRVSDDGKLSYVFFHQTASEPQHVLPTAVLESEKFLRQLIFTPQQP